ncbi:VF530 family protein [Shewanella sp. NKUCC05_KAH]|uniref:VF530 family protein n=1 Tax=Shewanella TaxID=22 RepID=UPI001C5B89D7|nr:MULTISPECIES: VF530 family protein [unclassified Shewanella]MBW3525586.1 VF530 family protein [Shewanella sp. NKUCC05_KAH]MCU7998031.1 VF530 family protein [Shewanella sp. SM95]MCU8021241.1 VF530 family protein [Shewanella sp. SM78]MCU8042820.1 VF530 family protein [Shewanella sp. SM68]MCU8047194.1 VF530 family protein [Shewanella sp. SM65]
MHNMNQSNNPLHGIKLETIITYLVEKYGWEELGERINIRCFTHDPSIKSSLRFLRKTEWARDKVEYLYLRANKLPLPPPKADSSQAAKKPAAKIATKKTNQTPPDKSVKSDKPSTDDKVNSHIWGNS